MKKRLRKKKHLGEFIEWGCRFVIVRNCKGGFNIFLDDFIEEAIEANNCYCGGGGKENILDVIVELGRAVDNPEARLKRIAAWLDARPDVQSYRTGRIIDLWYDAFEDVDEEIEPHLSDQGDYAGR